MEFFSNFFRYNFKIIEKLVEQSKFCGRTFRDQRQNSTLKWSWLFTISNIQNLQTPVCPNLPKNIILRIYKTLSTTKVNFPFPILQLKSLFYNYCLIFQLPMDISCQHTVQEEAKRSSFLFGQSFLKCEATASMSDKFYQSWFHVVVESALILAICLQFIIIRTVSLWFLFLFFQVIKLQ